MSISIYGFRFNSGIDVPIAISLEAPVGVRLSNTLFGTFHSP